MTPKDLLERLVDNAMDFLSQSIGEFDARPKYSVIHFHAAVELFLKARLMSEHWSLVVSKRKDPDWDKFVAGDFMSVSLDEAADKLGKIVRSGLNKQELETFRRLTKHRNKMVHFFHDAVSVEENEKLRRAIAREQLTAWYLLHKILTDKWDDVFFPWSEQLGEIDGRLRKLYEFLQVVFDQLAPEITKRKDADAQFKICPSCGFESQEHADELKELYKAQCLVCGLTNKCLSIECSDCGKPVLFVNEGLGQCEGCGREFEPEYIAYELIDNGAVHIAAMEGDDSWEPGNCSSCDGYHTVVRLGEDGDKYFCTSCFSESHSIQCCCWCNELNTGDMEYSYWAGCTHCDGKAGWDSDKDD